MDSGVVREILESIAADLDRAHDVLYGQPVGWSSDEFADARLSVVTALASARNALKELGD